MKFPGNFGSGVFFTPPTPTHPHHPPNSAICWDLGSTRHMCMINKPFLENFHHEGEATTKTTTSEILTIFLFAQKYFTVINFSHSITKT